MIKPNVTVTRRLPRAVEKSLDEAFDGTFNNAERAQNTAELKDAIMTAHAVLPTVTDRSSQWQNISGQRHAFTG